MLDDHPVCKRLRRFGGRHVRTLLLTFSPSAAGVTNPFENPDSRYLALVNDEGQYSLWPAGTAVPDGWRIAHGEDSRDACLDHIERTWTDLRPAGLADRG
jgi:MbtH protein